MCTGTATVASLPRNFERNRNSRISALKKLSECPRCGGDVAELQKGFFCQNEGCKFAIWKNNKWWELKRKQPTKAIVTALLKNGRAHVSGLYSEKTGKTYDATVVLEDDGQYANFKLEFDQQKGGKR